MNQSEKHLGVLTRLIKKENEGSNYFTAWVETPNSSEKFFHQNSLTNWKEIDNIEEGAFVLFKLKITKTKIGEREDADNCTLNCEKIILKDIIQYDIPTIKFIFRHAKDELKTKLVSKIETMQAKSHISDILSKTESIKKSLPKFFQITENQITETEQEIQQNLLVIKKVAPKSFLETIFEINTSEYNQNLFHILVDGIKTIDNEDVFQQAKFLLKFNSKTNNEIENLNSIFYHKATDDYKFRLWFDKLTNYCSTEILKFHFDKAELDFKSEIIQRCQGSENGFLVLNNQVKNPNEVEEIYFSDIREKLLQELNEAKKSIFVAVAWFTNDDLFGLLCMKLKQGIKVELIIINDYINNWEFGLPFQTFVDLGGKLYLSEYPNIMHHKFCLIDNETIFNGSYNWTYYAEMRNDENIMLFKGKPNLMKEFRTEFEKLKSKLGNSIDKVAPFDSSQIVRFERIAFREYFSTDLTLRVEKMKQKNENILYINKLTNTALDIDTENTDAKNFQREIQPEVTLLQRSIQVQNIIEDKTETVIDQSQEVSENQNFFENIEQDKDNVHENELTQLSNDECLVIDSKPVVNTQQTLIQETQKVIPTEKELKQEPIKQVSTPQIQYSPKVTTNFLNTRPVQVSKTAPVIIENYSVPKQEPVIKQFKNLKVTIALDISGSMDNLFKNGTVQQVVEKLLAVSLSISSNDQLDIWTFNDKSKRLNSVSKSNFQNYVNSNGILSNGGTDVSTALVDIDKKHFQESTGCNVFAVILTDGDIGELQTFVKNSCNKPIFWQFVGLGNDFAKLITLNSANKNVSFFSLNDISTISDDELYKKLLAEFPTWYKESETKGLIK